MNITRKTITITLTVLGLILGSMATIKTSAIPTRINVQSNEDVKILINNGGSQVSSVNFKSASMLPLHENNGILYFSPSLSLDDLVNDNRVSENYIYGSYEFVLNKATDNCYLQVEMVLDGEDEVNSALRCMVEFKNQHYILSPESPTALITTAKLSKTPIAPIFYIWYELADESCTIENLNAAEGVNITLNLYAYITE